MQTTDGLNIHCAIIDELHAHKTRDVWDVLETATGARLQSLLFGITTAGFNKEGFATSSAITPLRYCEAITATWRAR